MLEIRSQVHDLCDQELIRCHIELLEDHFGHAFDAVSNRALGIGKGIKAGESGNQLKRNVWSDLLGRNIITKDLHKRFD